MKNETKQTSLEPHEILSESAWSLNDILKKLVFAAEYLLNEKSYDGHNYEEIQLCVKLAKKIFEAGQRSQFKINRDKIAEVTCNNSDCSMDEAYRVADAVISHLQKNKG